MIASACVAACAAMPSAFPGLSIMTNAFWIWLSTPGGLIFWAWKREQGGRGAALRH
jgi:hypothetical protein